MPDFKLGDIVETTKGARFWGKIIALDNDEHNPGCTVLAVDPDFAGTKHVYPLKQISPRATDVVNIEDVPARHVVLGLGMWMAGTLVQDGLPSICLGPTPEPREIGAKPTQEDAAFGTRNGAIVISLANMQAALGMLNLVREAIEKAQKEWHDHAQ